MSRPRELTFVLRPEVQAELEEKLQLRAPVTVQVSSQPQTRLHGTYWPAARLVTLELNLTLFQLSSLRAVQREVIETVLHEYRHAYQHDHWSAERIRRDQEQPYHLQEMEADARRYANENVAYWMGLGMVKPKRVHSALGRLSKAEARVRH